MEYVRLEKLVELKQGLAINSHTNYLVSDHETKLALLRIADMPSKRKVVFMDEDTPDRYIADEDDIIYTRTGQVGLVFTGQNGVVHNNCFRVIPIDEQTLSRKYLFWALSLPEVYYMANIYAAGAAQPDLPHSSFKKIKIPICSLNNQKRIVSILSAYDNLIENNNKRIRLLEQMAENLYKEWFVRFRFPGHEKTEFENGLPIGWGIKKLGDWGISLESGGRPKGGIDDSLNNGVPSLGAEAIKGLAEYDYSSTKFVPVEFYMQMKRGKNSGNDILLYKDGAYIGKVTLFRDGFPYDKYSINEHVFFIAPNDVRYKNYLYYTLHQDAFFSLMQNLNRNAAQPGLSRPDIEKIKIAVPSEDVIIEFNKEVEPMLSCVFKLAKQNQFLARQRDLLLPRLMSGKLEVKV